MLKIKTNGLSKHFEAPHFYLTGKSRNRAYDPVVLICEGSIDFSVFSLLYIP